MISISRTNPPKKQKGQGLGPRTIDGAALDVRGGLIFLGWTEKKTRGMVERKLIPVRRLGSTRIIFIRAELEAWLANLPGCTLDEARANVEARR